MGKIKNILYPTDFSFNANQALPYAVDIARKCKGKFSMLSVYEIPMLIPSEINESANELREGKRSEIQDMFKQIITNYDLDSQKHRSYVREGGIVENIVGLAKSDKVQLIVMGTKGKSAEKGLFMGSVTKAVIQQAICPVLAIPSEAAFKRIKKIAFATELQFDESPLINYLVKFAEMYGASLEIFHVHQAGDSKEKSIKKLEKLVQNAGYPSLSYRIEESRDVVDGIIEHIDKLNVDLLAMTSYSTTLLDKLFHESLTKEALFRTRVPLLAFGRKKYDTIFL